MEGRRLGGNNTSKRASQQSMRLQKVTSIAFGIKAAPEICKETETSALMPWLKAVSTAFQKSCTHFSLLSNQYRKWGQRKLAYGLLFHASVMSFLPFVFYGKFTLFCPLLGVILTFTASDRTIHCCKRANALLGVVSDWEARHRWHVDQRLVHVGHWFPFWIVFFSDHMRLITSSHDLCCRCAKNESSLIFWYEPNDVCRISSDVVYSDLPFGGSHSSENSISGLSKCFSPHHDLQIQHVARRSNYFRPGWCISTDETPSEFIAKCNILA